MSEIEVNRSFVCQADEMKEKDRSVLQEPDTPTNEARPGKSETTCLKMLKVKDEVFLTDQPRLGYIQKAAWSSTNDTMRLRQGNETLSTMSMNLSVCVEDTLILEGCLTG